MNNYMHLVDGQPAYFCGDPAEWPEDLRVREFPQAAGETP